MWRHRDGPVDPPRSLHDVRYDAGTVSWPHPEPVALDPSYATYLDEARRVLAGTAPDPLAPPTVSDDFEHLRWFWLPAEAPNG